MKLIEYLQTEKDYKKFSYPADVRRIVNVMKKYNIEITPNEAEELWDRYSDDFDAQWLGLPNKDIEIFETIICYAKRKYKIDDYEDEEEDYE